MLISMENEWSLSQTIEGHSNVSLVCINPAKPLFGVIYSNTRAYIANIKTGKKTHFFDFNHGINSMCFNKDGNKVAILSYEPKSLIFDITAGEYKQELINSCLYNKEINSIYFDDNDNLVGLELDKKNNKINLFNLNTDKNINSYSYSSWATIVTISALKSLIATGSGNNKAYLFNTKKKKPSNVFELNSSVSALAFDSEEKLLAVASRDNLVQLFDLTTNEVITSFLHDNLVSSICFGQSSSVFITGSFDGKIRIFTKNHA